MNSDAKPVRISNPIRGRINACGFRLLEGAMYRAYCQQKKELFSDLPNEIVEVGPGVGGNFRFYPAGTRVLAIEPNVNMQSRLRKSAEDHELELSMTDGSGESIDLPSESVDVVVTTLVLCSVVDVSATIAEIHRILRPGGKYLFLEHVRSPRRGINRALQHLLFHPWRWMFEGCHLNRDTEQLLRESSFQEINLKPFQLRPSLIPFSPHIFGRAIR